MDDDGDDDDDEMSVSLVEKSGIADETFTHTAFVKGCKLSFRSAKEECALIDL